MTEHDREHGAQPENQHEDQHGVPRGPRHATYPEQETRFGRSFPLLAPVVVAITAGVILLLYVLIWR